ncbi:MAG: hypothetical protein LUG93_10805 [Lachnospiraceae bacterium]|nr:hypothetical protein [Lachnospiraceae bacterium]
MYQLCNHPLMDFNQAFHSYDTLEGANCQTLFGRKASQQEAAIEAVQKNGLHQIRDVEQSCFEEMPETYGMFCERLECLRAVDADHRQ